LQWIGSTASLQGASNISRRIGSAMYSIYTTPNSLSQTLKANDGRKKEKRDAATGVSAASARAVAARAVAFYLYDSL
jgi:hypothetical protein